MSDLNLTQSEGCDTVMVPVPRELVEREVMFDLMALRDERVLRRLSEEDRQRIGDNPAGKIVHLTTAQIAQVGSITQGTFCHGTHSFSKGVLCKILSLTIQVSGE